jgi:hypothetical protein
VLTLLYESDQSRDVNLITRSTKSKQWLNAWFRRLRQEHLNFTLSDSLAFEGLNQRLLDWLACGCFDILYNFVDICFEGLSSSRRRLFLKM